MKNEEISLSDNNEHHKELSELSFTELTQLAARHYEASDWQQVSAMIEKEVARRKLENLDDINSSEVIDDIENQNLTEQKDR